MSTLGFAVFQTAIGRCGIAWSERGVTGVQLPENNIEARMSRRFPGVKALTPPENIRQVIQGIVALLEGRPVDLTDIPLDMERVPPFHQRVYNVARAIPPGSTRTYGEIAARTGAPGSARAVGQALGRNPFAIIVPCHRVVAAAGKIGGFSAEGGANSKRRMLAIESGQLALEKSYDGELGRNYSHYRRPDPRIAAQIHAALGAAKRVVNVGAGTGAYEPDDREVVAVEPSQQMIAQRREGAAPAIKAGAESLPFEDRSFDAAMALLTVHHWSDREAGLAEMQRVARDRVVLLTWDPEHPGFWLVRDYFPDLSRVDHDIFPTMKDFQRLLGPIEIRSVMVPHDCTDGFLGAYWRRPQMYLDDGARSAISTFAKLKNVGPRLQQLKEDLDTGRWHKTNAALLEMEQIDLGYRLIVAENP